MNRFVQAQQDKRELEAQELIEDVALLSLSGYSITDAFLSCNVVPSRQQILDVDEFLTRLATQCNDDKAWASRRMFTD